MPATKKRAIIANVERLNERMDKLGLEAVAVRSGINFTYLAGMAMPGTLSRHLDMANTVRGYLLLWPRRGEPVIVLDSTADGVVRRDSWVEKVELYRAYVESLYTRFAAVLREHGLGRARVGFEQDALSVTHWTEIQQALPGLEMVDCSAMMDEVRWIKTPAEIALQKEAADLLDEAYLEVFPTIRPGDTERDVHARIVAACLRRGCGFVHGILNASSNTLIYGGEGDVPFRRGDFVWTDYVAYLDGYAGHQSRMAILGPPTPEQREGYALTLQVHRATIDQCRAGVTAGAVYDFVLKEFARRGIQYTSSLVGHSMGPWFHQQQPVLRRDSPVVLEEQMLLAIEPHRQYWHLQDLIVVQRGAPRLLSDRFPLDEVFVID